MKKKIVHQSNANVAAKKVIVTRLNLRLHEANEKADDSHGDKPQKRR